MEVQTKNRAPSIWLNGHAFAENIVCGGRTLPWESPADIAANYKQLQGILGADRLSLPLMGFFDSWLEANLYALRAMEGKQRVRYAIKRFLTHPAMRSDLLQLLTAVCGTVDADIMLELPSNTALINWAHSKANPDSPVGELGELDVDSVSVYLADTVRELKPSGISGVVATVSVQDVRSGARAELYKPLANVAANYQWQFAFRRPVCDDKQAFDAEGFPSLGCFSVNEAPGVGTLPADFWRGKSSAIDASVQWWYAELPAFVEPESVRGKIATLRNPEPAREAFRQRSEVAPH